MTQGSSSDKEIAAKDHGPRGITSSEVGVLPEGGREGREQTPAVTGGAASAPSAAPMSAAYNFERHEWQPQCPHGDICTGCDARGYCTRMENRDPQRRRVSGLPERPAIASEERRATSCPYVTSGTGKKTPLNCVYEKGHAGEHVYA